MQRCSANYYVYRGSDDRRAFSYDFLFLEISKRALTLFVTRIRGSRLYSDRERHLPVICNCKFAEIAKTRLHVGERNDGGGKGNCIYVRYRNLISISYPSSLACDPTLTLDIVIDQRRQARARLRSVYARRTRDEIIILPPGKLYTRFF